MVPPESSILIGFSIINHPFWGTPIFGNIHIFSLCISRLPHEVSTDVTTKRWFKPGELRFAASTWLIRLQQAEAAGEQEVSLSFLRLFWGFWMKMLMLFNWNKWDNKVWEFVLFQANQIQRYLPRYQETQWNTYHHIPISQERQRNEIPTSRNNNYRVNMTNQYKSILNPNICISIAISPRLWLYEVRRIFANPSAVGY